MHPEVPGRVRKLRRELENIVDEMSRLAGEHVGAYKDRDAALGWLERGDMIARVVASLPESGEESVGRFPWRLERRTDLG